MAQVYHKGPLTFAPPDAVLENDVQAWRKAMATANIVLTQQEDHLFHLEDQLASPDLSADFLARNADLEAGVGFYRQKLQEVSRAAHEVQVSFPVSRCPCSHLLLTQILENTPSISGQGLPTAGQAHDQAE